MINDGGMVGGTRIELVTSSVSTKRSPPELTAQMQMLLYNPTVSL